MTSSFQHFRIIFQLLAAAFLLVVLTTNVVDAQGNATPNPPPGPTPTPGPPVTPPKPQPFWNVYWNNGCKDVTGCSAASECYCGGYNSAYCGFLCKKNTPSKADLTKYSCDNSKCQCRCDYKWKS